MAKISPVSIKYMIYASFQVEGALEKPDVIGALFGQTEGLLGTDLELRDLQKEGKIGRIEVDIERKDKITTGKIKIPTALDQSETTLIAAAIETIEKIGPCDAQIEVEKIEDVRGSKRDYIIERAKKLLADISSKTDSREISNEIKESTRVSSVKEYGEERLPYGDLSGQEIIVVEGRADVLNLLRAGVKNVIAMNGTKLPESIKKLSHEKEITLFVDGDRGGKLIAQNVTDNTKVKYIASAPDGKEVEELTGKEVLMCLRKKMPVSEFFFRTRNNSYRESQQETEKVFETKESDEGNKINEKIKNSVKEIAEKSNKKGKVIILGKNLEEIKTIPVKSIGNFLKKNSGQNEIFALIVDGTATKTMIEEAEKANVKILAAKNFKTTDTKIELIGF